MQFTSKNLLILILVVQLVLICHASAFDWFKKKDDKTKEEEAAKKAAAQKGEVPGGKNEPISRRNQQPQQDEFDQEDDEDDEQAPGGSGSKAGTIIDRMNKIRNDKAGQLQRGESSLGRYRKRPDLDKIREAAKAQQRIEDKQRVPKRRGYSTNNKKVQGQGRRADNRRRRREEEEARQQTEDEADEAEEELNDQDAQDEADEDDDDKEEEEEFAASKLLERLKNKDLRNHAATKFVSTKPQEGGRASLKPKLDFLKTSPKSKSGLISGTIKKNKLVEASYWQKKLGSAYKATKKGLKESAKVISEMPKYMEKSIDSINAFLQLDSKGKVLALIDEANGDANFVRKEFSQFTLSWSPIMEKALDYLGDEDLDKIKWSDKDELDLKKDALNSLAFGFEFMRLMIIWRENLLVAHEAYKSWLNGVKSEVEAKKLELDEDVIIQLRTTHTYMMLATWMTIEEAAHEARTKLDYLMDVMDDRPKNYESEYFRNIVVLQELYEPTIEEFDKERNQVVDSISESGVVVENLSDVNEYFETFRSSLASHDIKGIDWEVPQQLEDFMEKLKPQLSRSSLVYTKAFLKEIGLKK